ncbi:uncharacterized protein LOC118481728 [Helianthus annuus]|uniref:uncharacterized protein LOC118481728 n=1 Tax=Helianthus annuus TaxID=4232 RepID=UPI001652BF7A|nr:uncharacterized protein LOC118481728 [Helianthus annuus]
MAHEILVERLLRSTVLSFPWMRTLKEAMVEEIIDIYQISHEKISDDQETIKQEKTQQINPTLRSCARNQIVGSSLKGFFGVYDGQGGSKAAEYVVKNMHSNVFDLCITTRGNLISERLKRLHKITIQVILRFIIIR